ncbi:hypothetical protein VSR69_31205 [Paraburkholderia phytofirmans]|uniref:hypothetical protein n=1 Tax=Paraburkholderia sp. BL9I2N2 TaxID=1938809 RepID=UPI00104A5F2D|nr:hypothetical protein [Paraburkholderia sp. BL9I2N2]
MLPIDDAAKASAQIGLMEFQVALSAALAEFGTPTAAPGVTRIVSAFLTELQVELVSDTTDGAADGTAHSDRAH